MTPTWCHEREDEERLLGRLRKNTHAEDLLASPKVSMNRTVSDVGLLEQCAASLREAIHSLTACL